MTTRITAAKETKIFADIFCLALRIPRQTPGIESNYFVVVVFVLSGGGRRI